MPDEETSEDIDCECSPWERVGDYALVEHHLHAVAQYAAGTAAKEYSYQ